MVTEHAGAQLERALTTQVAVDNACVTELENHFQEAGYVITPALRSLLHNYITESWFPERLWSEFERLLVASARTDQAAEEARALRRQLPKTDAAKRNYNQPAQRLEDCAWQLEEVLLAKPRDGAK